MKFLDPTNDIAFKKIFGDKNKTDILISFLNAVLDFSGDMAIANVTLDTPYQLPPIKELKDTILDVTATSQSGKQFIIEMQKRNLSDFVKRSQFYSAKAYSSQLGPGESYSELKPVYFIGIVDFSFLENEYYLSRHLIINSETKTQDLKDLEFCYIELPKFNLAVEELEKTVDKWVYFLKNAASMELIPNTLQTEPSISRAFEAAQQANWNMDKMKVYDYISKKNFDAINEIEAARKEGKIEGQIEERAQIIRNLHASGMSPEDIAQFTKLSTLEMKETLIKIAGAPFKS